MKERWGLYFPPKHTRTSQDELKFCPKYWRSEDQRCMSTETESRVFVEIDKIRMTMLNIWKGPPLPWRTSKPRNQKKEVLVLRWAFNFSIKTREMALESTSAWQKVLKSSFYWQKFTKCRRFEVVSTGVEVLKPWKPSFGTFLDIFLKVVPTPSELRTMSLI